MSNGGNRCKTIKSIKNQFNPSFSHLSTSKIIWQEDLSKRRSTINHHKTRYNILNQKTQSAFSCSGVTTAGRTDKSYSKVNGISQFMEQTRSGSPNLSPDYQKAIFENGKVFRKTKGMCSSIANNAKTHHFISPVFGRR